MSGQYSKELSDLVSLQRYDQHHPELEHLTQLAIVERLEALVDAVNRVADALYDTWGKS